MNYYIEDIESGEQILVSKEEYERWMSLRQKFLRFPKLGSVFVVGTSPSLNSDIYFNYVQIQQNQEGFK